MNFKGKTKKILEALSRTTFQTSREISNKTGISVQYVTHALRNLEHQYVEKRTKNVIQTSRHKAKIYEWRLIAKI